ncbi:carboxypeptidase O-like [Bombina bombina]|uniref:carboxypeptidase O-like n=1 Tax=Bombina bombina TaxID=8345 RepID=UPI00235AADCB|nr:carboxypeptidase O-like [Bombina bombina]
MPTTMPPATAEVYPRNQPFWRPPHIFTILLPLRFTREPTEESYRDQVLRLIPQSVQHAKHIQEISTQLQLDVWKPHNIEDIFPGNEIDVHVPFATLQQLKENLLQYDIQFEVLINDVQELIDRQTMGTHIRKKRSLANFDYNKYHPMDEIYHWMEQIKEKYSDLVTMHYLGSTYELRPIFYFKIGSPSDKQKKVIWMDCGIHAREWISVAFCQWFIKEILHNHDSNPIYKKALQNIDFYIVPVLNIDGYIYSWQTDRLWRKSRSPHNNNTCYGVDLNRNFDSQWCSIGASRNCSEMTFCGTGPASEPEAKALSQLVGSLKSDILCFLTIHSYSQLILLPYGYTKNQSVNHMEMLTVAQRAADKLKARHGTQYKVGSASQILYSNSGSSRDWATDLGIPFSYTFELRDNGTYGFQLPENQIKPTCEETTDGMITILEHINEKYFNSATSIFSEGLWMSLFLSCIISTYLTVVLPWDTPCNCTVAVTPVCAPRRVPARVFVSLAEGHPRGSAIICNGCMLSGSFSVCSANSSSSCQT